MSMNDLKQAFERLQSRKQKPEQGPGIEPGGLALPNQTGRSPAMPQVEPPASAQISPDPQAQPAQPAQPESEASSNLEKLRESLGRVRERDQRTLGGQAKASGMAMARTPGALAGGAVQGLAVNFGDARKDITKNPVYQAGEAISDWSTDTFQVDPLYEGRFATDLAGGIASMGTFMLTGSAGGGVARGLAMRAPGSRGLSGSAAAQRGDRAARAGQMGTAVGLAANSGANEAFQRAVDAGLSQEDAQQIARTYGNVAGAVQVANINFLLRALPQGSRKQVADRILWSMASEGAVEGAGAIIQNLAEQSYNPDRGLFDGVAYQSLIGALSAGGAQLGRLGISKAMGDRDGGSGPQNEQQERLQELAERIKDLPPEQQAEAVQSELDEILGNVPSIDEVSAVLHDTDPEAVAEFGTQGADAEAPAAPGVAAPVEPGPADVSPAAPDQQQGLSLSEIQDRRRQEAQQQQVQRQAEDQAADEARQQARQQEMDQARERFGPALRELEQQQRLRPGTIDADRDDLLTAIRKLGGIDADNTGGEVDLFTAYRERRPGQPLVRRDGQGRTLDDLAESLNQYGYTGEDGMPLDPNTLTVQIESALSGNRIFSGSSNRASMIDPDNTVARSYFGGNRKDMMNTLRKKIAGEKLGPRQEEAIQALDDLIRSGAEQDYQYSMDEYDEAGGGGSSDLDRVLIDAMLEARRQGASQEEIWSIVEDDNASIAAKVGSLSAIGPVDAPQQVSPDDARQARIAPEEAADAEQRAFPEAQTAGLTDVPTPPIGAYSDSEADAGRGREDVPEGAARGAASPAVVAPEADAPVSDPEAFVRGMYAERINQMNVTPEQGQRILDMLMERVIDGVTGWMDVRSGDLKSVIDQRMREWQGATGESLVFISIDISNLGGLNAYHKEVSQYANHDFRGITDSMLDSLLDSGFIPLPTRSGGDELGMHMAATVADAEEAMAKAKMAVNAYADSQGFGDIPHAKGKPMRGVSIHYAVVEVRSDMQPGEAYNLADGKLKGITDEAEQQAEAGAEQGAGQRSLPERVQQREDGHGDQDGTEGSGEEAGLELTQETEAQRADREAEQAAQREAEQAEAAEAEQRRQADADRDDFVLAGSDRDADQAAARGQTGLFDASGAADSAPDPATATVKDILSHRIRIAASEIQADIDAGTHSADVTAFSQLHDNTDANLYINDADRSDRVLGPLGKRLGWGQQDFTEASNLMIQALDAWLEGGRRGDAARHLQADLSSLQEETAKPEKSEAKDPREQSETVKRYWDSMSGTAAPVEGAWREFIQWFAIGGGRDSRERVRYYVDPGHANAKKIEGLLQVFAKGRRGQDFILEGVVPDAIARPLGLVDADAEASIPQGQVGMKLAEGDVVLTSSGRETTPYPRIDTSTNRKAALTVKRVDKWLMENALAEARARGDGFNARSFDQNKLNPSQSDKDSAEQYLFTDPTEAINIPGMDLEADASRAETDPSPAQIEAGNYRKGHTRLHGFDISIENPRGSVRRGTDPDGNQWEREVPHHYGYIKRTDGADGDHVDVFIGPNPESTAVFVVDQVDQGGQFDEHKILMGFDSQDDAVAGYKAAYQAGWNVGPVTETSLEVLSRWLDEGNTRSEFADFADSLGADADETGDIGDALTEADMLVQPPEKVVRANDLVKVYHKKHGWMSPDEAAQKLEEWRQNAKEQGESTTNHDKVVLSLFDMTGQWSQPWEDAGYEVWRFDIQTDPVLGDVNNFSVEFFNDTFGMFEGKDIYAILAACPCTDFASSGARHFAAKDKDGRTRSSIELVNQTMRAIEYFKPPVWAIENPVGRIQKLTGLPPWRYSFDPYHFGHGYTKKTLLWGRFGTDLPIAPVDPVEGSKMMKYGGASMATKNARSVTPEGFAYSFFQANNAVDNPKIAIGWKYSMMDQAVIDRAVDAGFSDKAIDQIVEDHYYMELDYEGANAALSAAIDGQAADSDPDKRVEPMAGVTPMPEWRKNQARARQYLNELVEAGVIDGTDALREASRSPDPAVLAAAIDAALGDALPMTAEQWVDLAVGGMANLNQENIERLIDMVPRTRDQIESLVDYIAFRKPSVIGAMNRAIEAEGGIPGRTQITQEERAEQLEEADNQPTDEDLAHDRMVDRRSQKTIVRSNGQRWRTRKAAEQWMFSRHLNNTHYVSGEKASGFDLRRLPHLGPNPDEAVGWVGGEQSAYVYSQEIPIESLARWVDGTVVAYDPSLDSGEGQAPTRGRPPKKGDKVIKVDNPDWAMHRLEGAAKFGRDRLEHLGDEFADAVPADGFRPDPSATSRAERSAADIGLTADGLNSAVSTIHAAATYSGKAKKKLFSDAVSGIEAWPLRSIHRKKDGSLSAVGRRQLSNIPELDGHVIMVAKLVNTMDIESGEAFVRVPAVAVKQISGVKYGNDTVRLVPALPAEEADQPSAPSEDRTRGAKKPHQAADFGKNNKVFTKDEADAAIARLRGKLGRPMAGIDPSMMADVAKVGAYYIEGGVRAFGDYTRAMVEALGAGVRPYIRGSYENIRWLLPDADGMSTGEQADAVMAEMDNEIKQLTNDQRQDLDAVERAIIRALDRAEEVTDAPGTSGDLEQDSGDTAAFDELGAGRDAADAAGAGQRAGQRGAQAQDRDGSESDSGATGDPAAVGREPRHLEMDFGAESSGAEAGAAGGGGRGRGGRAGNQGVPAQQDAGRATDEGFSPSSLTKKRKAQDDANSVVVQLGDLSSIEASLPYLTADQRLDVRRAETRLIQQEKRGILFTNGTGTGKTYTGGGIIARFYRAGRRNQLIVVPSQAKADDWIEDMANLGLEVTKLTGIRDEGLPDGISITTYANFSTNMALLRRDWDLVTYDESHRLNQNQSNTTAPAAQAMHFGNTNKPGNLFMKAQARHDGWLKAYYQMREDTDAFREKRIKESTEKNGVPPGPGEMESIAELAAMDAKKAFYDKVEPFRQEIQAETERLEAESANEGKALFLSATPFAYHFNLDYADGYLFEYDQGADGQAYNSGDGRDRFYMTNFGYRMRYNKLTLPESGVDVSLMEREFHEQLKKQGAVSSRQLDVDFDYSRDFVTVNDKLGMEIDRGIKLVKGTYRFDDTMVVDVLRRAYKYNGLSQSDAPSDPDAARKDPLLPKFEMLEAGSKRHFSYAYIVQLREAVIARHMADRIRSHLDMKRKVVLFHDYRKPPGRHPFDFGKVAPPKMGDDAQQIRAGEQLRTEIDMFKDLFPELVQLDLAGLKSVNDLIIEQFGNRAEAFNGTTSDKQKTRAKELFNDHDSGTDIIVVQRQSGKEGLSLHDIKGDMPRALLDLGLPIRPTDAIQTEGRVYRMGLASNAILEYPILSLDFERSTFAQKVAERARTPENLAMGEVARDMEMAFKEGYQNASEVDVSPSQGKGGKERDRTVKAISSFDRAKTYYFANQKNTKKRSEREGKDYFATPEPLGFKMVEWLDSRANDRLLEPSAGHGAIGRFFPGSTRNTFVEPAPALASRLGLNINAGEVKTHRFEDLHVGNKYEGIAMNPPFGMGGSDAIPHLAKAARHLSNGGRLVALIPRGGAADKRFDAFMESDEANGIYHMASILLPQVAFERAGTKVSSRVVVLEKHLLEENRPDSFVDVRDLSDASTIAELFDRLENLDMPARTVTSDASEGSDPLGDTGDTGGADAVRAEADTSMELYEFPHTKTGETVYLAIPKARLSNFGAINLMAKSHGGWYNRFAGGQARRGFAFKSDAARQEFVSDMQQDGVSDPSARYSMAGDGSVPATRDSVESFAQTVRDEAGLETLSLFLSSGNKLNLDSIIVAKDNRGSGAGSKAMEMITEFADAHGLRVVLSPAVRDDFQGTTSRSRLVKFYKRFGFVENKGRNKDFSISKSMYRDPVAGSRYSAAEQPGGMPATDLQKAVKDSIGDLSSSVKVVQSAADLPRSANERLDAVSSEAEQAGEQLESVSSDKIEGLYDSTTGDVYLVADNISSAERGAWVAWHELFHRGVRDAFPDQRQYGSGEATALRQALNKAGLNKAVRRLADAIATDRDLPPSQRLVAIEEALAELNAADETGNLQAIEDRYGVSVPASMMPGIRGLIGRFFDAVRAVLRRLGIARNAVLDRDIMDLIGRARSGYAASQSRNQGVMERGGNPAQADLFAPAPEDIKVSVENAYQRAELVETGSILLDDMKIVTSKDAATFLRPYSDFTQEQFVALAMDENGDPIHIIRGPKGTIDGAAVYPEVLLADLVLSGAKSYWIAHNHPSGVTTPSDADRAITQRIVRKNQAMGIDMNGHVILGDSQWTAIGNDGENIDGGDYSAKSETQSRVRIMDRMVVNRREDRRQASITSPSDAKNLVDSGAINPKEQTGIVALDSKHRVLGVINIPDGMDVNNLTDNDNDWLHARELVREISQLNAAAAITFGKTKDSTKNLIGLLNHIDIRVLDALDEKGNSLSNSGGDTSNDVFFSVREGTTKAAKRQKSLLRDIASQPVDRLFRALFDVLDLVDSHGRLKKGVELDQKARHILTEWKPHPEGHFSWMGPMLESARAGLIDRHGLSKEYRQRWRETESDIRGRLSEVYDLFTDKLENMTPAEARVLQSILTGEQIGDDSWQALAEPIRRSIDDMGQEMVSLGLISAESYERNRAQYLHRSYTKHEAQFTGLSGWVNKMNTKRRRRIQGDSLKQRGIDAKVSMEEIKRSTPDEWWGSRMEAGHADTSLKGAELILFEKLAPVGEGTGTLAGVEEGGPRKRRVIAREYWPADRPIPAKYAAWESRGKWEVRGTKGGKVVIWRDYTKAERAKMGEILDARYNIVKTYETLSHDIAMGKFFQDIATNPEWFSSDLPTPGVGESLEIVDALQASRMSTFAGVDWVKVPDVKIGGADGARRWGAMSGGYVRAEIWRDLNELDKMQMQGSWRALLTQWKLNKTARSPVVHMNNIMSNFMLMDMADVRATDFVRGLQAYASDSKEYRDAMQYGAFEASFINQEIRRRILEPVLNQVLDENLKGDGGFAAQMSMLSKFGYGLTKALKTADRKMVEYYQIEDEVFRMATYMRRLSLGDTPQEAAAMAREQFLDYDIRAPWVNAARRTVLPFISYTYRAVPVVAQSLVHRPWKLAKYFTVAYLAQALSYELAPGDEEEERRTMRREAQGYTWVGVPRMIRMPWRDDHGNPVFLDVRRWIPAGDVFDMNQGQSALPIPAPLQFGGPLMLGAELALNKQAFTGREIINRDTDTGLDVTRSVANWGWKSWMPSAAWIPGSWYFERITRAHQGGRDMLGRPFSVPQAYISSTGIKLQPHDVQLGYHFRSGDLNRSLSSLRFEARQLASDLNRGLISQTKHDREFRRIEAKIQRLDDEARKLRGD